VWDGMRFLSLQWDPDFSGCQALKCWPVLLGQSGQSMGCCAMDCWQ
jgi:hypothetical protein